MTPPRNGRVPRAGLKTRRADPDQLLKQVQRGEERAGKGKLKIFLGMAPGVGKTFAMLEAARRERDSGVDVVIGFVETHGRVETAALLDGLPILPRQTLLYRDKPMEEFDVDGALRRLPERIVVDELAHTNVPGSRHAKRWQDVMELLDAGMDVWTTVNVQHLESLNDVVAQITGVRVRETLPDAVLERADDVELVDIPPDALLERLLQGKVYPIEQARSAAASFFRKGNLMALRELALRRTAERVDADVLAYRREHGIAQTWPVAEQILVCVGPRSVSTAVIRAARRIAAGLHAPWTAAFVEIPARPLAQEDRARVAQHLRLAEELGAEVVVLSGDRLSDELIAYARTHNVTRIIMGKPTHPPWRDKLFGSLVDDVVRGTREIDVLVTAGDLDSTATAPAAAARRQEPAGTYLSSAGIVALSSGVAWLMFGHVDLANLVMVYLLGIVFVAIRFGRGPSILASVLSVAVFDFCFVPPYLTFAVADVNYLFTFLVMFVVALVISSLTVRVQQQAQAARLREQRTASLYRLTRELARATSVSELASAAVRSVGNIFDGKVAILLPDRDGTLQRLTGEANGYEIDDRELGVARWAFEHGEPAGLGTATLPGAGAMYLPLSTRSNNVGVLGILPADSQRIEDPEQRQLLGAFCKQTAVAIERTALAEEARSAKVRAEQEELRNTLLSSVSHDLRTPLAAITGAASTLLEDDSVRGGVRRELLETIAEEAARLNRLVGNLVDMTRLESGGIVVRKEWIPMEEIVGSALQRLQSSLGERPVRVNLPPDLPLLSLDGVLIEQVFVNLLENAVKYTPEGTPIEITARVERGFVVVEVADRGPGVPIGDEEKVFEKFFRGPNRGVGGTGLGLTISRGMLRAHGGDIIAENRPLGGALFRLSIPLDGEPPEIPREASAGTDGSPTR